MTELILTAICTCLQAHIIGMKEEEESPIFSDIMGYLGFGQLILTVMYTCLQAHIVGMKEEEGKKGGRGRL